MILFPAGWFYDEEQEARKLYEWLEKNIVEILQAKKRDSIIILGIDGRFTKEEIAIDQIAVAISKNGIVGLARKFYPTKEERGIISCACDHLSDEEGKSRIVALNNKKFYLCVCNDIFGIEQLKLVNPGIDFVLNLVHCFYPKEEEFSDEFFFARNGFAEASKRWKCPVFVSAVFFRRKIPEYWPSGVMWNQGYKQTMNWNYTDNPLMPMKEFQLKIKEGQTVIRIFNIETPEVFYL